MALWVSTTCSSHYFPIFYRKISTVCSLAKQNSSFQTTLCLQCQCCTNFNTKQRNKHFVSWQNSLGNKSPVSTAIRITQPILSARRNPMTSWHKRSPQLQNATVPSKTEEAWRQHRLHWLVDRLDYWQVSSTCTATSLEDVACLDEVHLAPAQCR